MKSMRKRNGFLEHSSTTSSDKREFEKDKMQEPLESYRSLSILPTADDIKSPCSFLRPSIVKGKYTDTEHYLDVQFRLLREDFIQPLRDGISEYMSIKKKSLGSCKDVRVYSNVCICSEIFVDGDLLHVLKFRDRSFTKIKWGKSTRLMYGNVLCLSTNHFHSMLFATVVERELKDLKKGLLTVKFEGINEALLNLSDNFVVIETSTLFEAYRHNLKVLQQLNDESLPMKRHIVDVEKTVNKPQYLLSTTKYDMTPLLLPMNKKIRSTKNRTARDGDKSKIATVLQDCSWPSAIALNLNESQYLALKLAITKEFSIIQGPPGTGKTYVGLRAVQLLLHNMEIWYKDYSNALPILVVCYTNHALDQFLVGISKFTEKIARIGGRGNNKEIDKYRMKNLVGKYRIPHYGYLVKLAKSESCKLRKKIYDIDSSIKNSTKYVLSEHILKDYMLPIQYKSISSFPKKASTVLSQNVNYQESNHVYNWLQIEISQKSFAEKMPGLPDPSESQPVTETFDEVDNEGETDIEFIINQRNIDYYDFANAQVLIKKELWDERAGAERQLQRNNKKELDNYILENLQKNHAMPAYCVKRITNVWILSTNQRWQLYKFWLECFVEEKRKIQADLQKELSIAMKEIANLRVQKDLAVLENIHVLGMTTTGAAKYRHILDARNPVILVVEEAAEILESHIITCLTPKTQHVILIGDQQQLRPSPTVYMLATKYGMNISLFERMIKNGVEYCCLSVQHRMRPEIASLIVPHIYPNLKNHETVTKFENIKGVSKNVFFVNHKFEEFADKYSKSKANEHEARFLLRLCNYLLLQGYEPSQITVLTTYSAQLFALKSLATNDLKKIHFTVVDSFQGEENDIILISFVRSNNEGEVGFLKVPNRVCVALSRAKKGLYCIGNFELYSQKSQLWKNIKHTLSEAKSIGQFLCLVCQNHPDIITEVKTDKDFDSCPEGGCNRNCDYQLECGHSCVLFCHPYDRKHENIKCKKPCIKSCVNGHPCNKKCFQNCKPCKTLMDRVLSKCGHTVNAPCGMDEDEIMCNNPCNKICRYDHPCPKECFECSGFCEVLIDRLLSSCGHTVNAKCGELEAKIKCENPCEKTCDKGHLCSKKCYQYCGSCETLIDRLLPCGHTVNAPCGKSEYSIQCQYPCTKSCERNHKCPRKCYENCGSCQILIERVLSRCGHTVNAGCGKSESTIMCENPCSKSCERGHQCTKKCFELCICEIPVNKICNVCGSSDNFPCKDISHAKCQRPCPKKCSRDHCCPKKCFELCYCDTIVEKTLKCSHKVLAECGKSEGLLECLSKCEKLLSCQHRCKKMCYERCTTECLEIIDVKSPICGHDVEIQCRLKGNRTYLIRNCTELCNQILPCNHTCKSFCRRCRTIGSHSECKEVCTRKLPCGHECYRRCNEPCEVKCMQITDIYLSVCGHSIKVECFMRNNLEELFEKCPELCKEVLSCGHTCEGTCGTCKQGKEHIKCMKACNKKLTCLHECKNICSKPCTSECMQLVEVQSSVCKHLVEIECCFSWNFDKLSLKCCEPCLEILPCGHTCKGSCGKCYQGRLHITCKETCEKILMCGHKCESKCFKSCPPCEKPCENKCFHGKCRKKCGDPCDKCNKPCTWRCRHKKCNRRCNEICDREPCNEPCLKVMTCNHPCVGFCGEPCPKQCFICDTESNQYSNEVPNNNSVGYIYLEDCNHLVQEKELSEWLTTGITEVLEIRLRKCPKCRTIIWNNFRFNKIIKKSLAEVEKVKQLTKRYKYEKQKIQTNLVRMINATNGNISAIYKRILEDLSSNCIRDTHELTKLENVISIAIEIECKTYSTFATNTILKSLIDYILFCKKRLRFFILDNFISISEFQLLQLTREVHRIHLLDFMLTFANKIQLTSMSPEFESCLKCLTTSKSFTDSSIEDFGTVFKKLSDRFPYESSDVPKSNFTLKIMSMSGYWYFCPQKHVNCIAGKIETAQKVCYECEKNTMRCENRMVQMVSQSKGQDREKIQKISDLGMYKRCEERDTSENRNVTQNVVKNNNRALHGNKKSVNTTNVHENALDLGPVSFAKLEITKSSQQLSSSEQVNKDTVFASNSLQSKKQNAKQRQPEFFYDRRVTIGRGRGSNRSVIASSENENASDCGRSSLAKPEITRSSQQLSSSEQVNKDTVFATNSRCSNKQNTKQRQPKFFSERRANIGRGRGRNKSVIASSANENAADCGQSSLAKPETKRSSKQLTSSEQINKDTGFETNSPRSKKKKAKQIQPEFFSERRVNIGRGRRSNKSVIASSCNENASDCGRSSFAKPEIKKSSQQLSSSE